MADSSGSPSSAACSATDSCSRAAALPVGAARAMRRPGSCSSASTRATVWVLPVPGPPASTVVQRVAASAAPRRCRSGRRAGEQRVQPRRVDRRGPGELARGEGVADGLLLPPVAVEVEQRTAVGADQPQRGQGAVHRGRRERAARDRRLHLLRGRPGQRRHVDLGVVDGHLGQPGQLDADRPEPHRPDGEGGGQQDDLVVLATELLQPQGDVDVGGGQHPGGVEGAQQPGRALHQPDLGHRPASRSESSTTRAAGGCQSKTPQPAGVSGPTIPRTNR